MTSFQAPVFSFQMDAPRGMDAAASAATNRLKTEN
jgi:hypothetical protein